MQPIIEFTNVAKRFALHRQRSRSFQELVVNLVRPEPDVEEFWALRDVSFAVERGETFGIIGDNGSGKSTSLKLISGILEPTRGRVKAVGKISALLELGAGFHPDLTGNENIFLNGSILGMSRREMQARYRQIVEFSELQQFIDIPIKFYSSGMYMRLAFAIAVSVDPDILLTDEILAVGDEAFQTKCIERIEEFRNQGKTIIFVSHNLEAIRNLCRRALWLDHGSVRSLGDVDQVLYDYHRHVQAVEEQYLEQQPQLQAEEPAREVEAAEAAPRKRGSGAVQITQVEMLDATGTSRHLFDRGDSLTVRVHFTRREAAPALTIGVSFHRVEGIYVFGTDTAGDRIDLDPDRGFIDLEMPELQLLPGSYALTVGCWPGTNVDAAYDWHEGICKFRIEEEGSKLNQGLVYLPHRWASRPAAVPVSLDRRRSE